MYYIQNASILLTPDCIIVYHVCTAIVCAWCIACRSVALLPSYPGPNVEHARVAHKSSFVRRAKTGRPLCDLIVPPLSLSSPFRNYAIKRLRSHRFRQRRPRAHHTQDSNTWKHTHTHTQSAHTMSSPGSPSRKLRLLLLWFCPRVFIGPSSPITERGARERGGARAIVWLARIQGAMVDDVSKQAN